MNCQLVIAIDSTHLSELYKGSLFFATTYDVDNDMFLIAFCIVNSKIFKDWLWFL